MRRLTIISHTEHYQNDDGKIVGLGSTVTEINNLIDVFDEIIHVAMLHKESAPLSSLPYTSKKITFIPIEAMGGPTFRDKVNILFKMPSVLRTVSNAVSRSDYFQFRAPTGIGTYVIPHLVWFSSKKGWFKYAGNWQQENAPLAYRFQRWLLKQQKRKVTINGFWDDQPKHCLSFENPCLTIDELKKGEETIKAKELKSEHIEICFVGRIEAEKGIGLLIDALTELPEEKKKKIVKVHIVGDGRKKAHYRKAATNSEIDFHFYGLISRDEVHRIYQRSHFMILPSASEGFPKVISEAMNYGCIPVVSNVSSISHYIKHQVNGFLIDPLTKAGLIDQLIAILDLNGKEYELLVRSGKSETKKFTYSFYNERIRQEIIESMKPVE